MPAGKNAIRATRGYTLKQVGKKGVALMRGRSNTATFTCECSKTGGCVVKISGTAAFCQNDGCTSDCEWTIRVAGLAGAWIARKT